ncbi:type II toxin-antitoxin system VapC family toxin [Candidatus Poribacteria bacterium]|nr:type II toxin-antitoxin system VapC family toxin [Candidatus Poribacteria bacterium]
MANERYILESNTVSAILRGHQGVHHRITLVPAERIFLTVVSAFENLRGWFAQVNKQQPTEQLVRVFNRILQLLDYYGRSQVLPYDMAAATKYEELRRQHRRLGRDDLRIAAIALVQDAILVTQNVRDFVAIEGLRVENWLS